MLLTLRCWRELMAFGIIVLTLVPVHSILLAQAKPDNTIDLNSPRLQGHASLANHDTGGTPLMELLANARSAAVERGIPWKGLQLIGFSHELLDPNIPILQQYQDRACAADAVAVGHVTQWKAHLSSRATAIYSDYVFVIDALLKDNRASSIQSHPAIVVTRPGGAITLENEPISLQDKAYPPLLPSTKYLLFLRYIPGSSGYAPVDSFSTFAATDAGWNIAGPKVVPGTAFTRDELATTIQNWLASCK